MLARRRTCASLRRRHRHAALQPLGARWRVGAANCARARRCVRRACKKTHLSSLNCSLCLSRACLGKTVMFSAKWHRKKMRFRACSAVIGRARLPDAVRPPCDHPTNRNETKRNETTQNHPQSEQPLRANRRKTKKRTETTVVRKRLLLWTDSATDSWPSLAWLGRRKGKGKVKGVLSVLPQEGWRYAYLVRR